MHVRQASAETSNICHTSKSLQDNTECASQPSICITVASTPTCIAAKHWLLHQHTLLPSIPSCAKHLHCCQAFALLTNICITAKHLHCCQAFAPTPTCLMCNLCKRH